MKRVISFGETLLRIDVSPENDIKIFPTGTSLNFLTNLSRLGGVETILASSLSNKKDAKIVLEHLDKHKIDNWSFEANTDALGSYQMYRTPTMWAWEVVYNRKTTSWTEYAQSPKSLLNTLKKDDIFHFDGISLYSSNFSLEKTLSELHKVKKVGARIIFDFNLRKSIAPKNIENIFERILKQIDYLNISYYDLVDLLQVKTLDKKAISLFREKFPNIKEVFGTKKETISKTELGISAFQINGEDFDETNVTKYQPKELIGQGDSFSACVMHGLITKNKIDIKNALDWCIYKTQFIGDANVPTLQEYKNQKKDINVYR